jgi:hypothetical protein
MVARLNRDEQNILIIGTTSALASAHLVLATQVSKLVSGI